MLLRPSRSHPIRSWSCTGGAVHRVGNNYLFLRHGDAGAGVTTSISLAVGNRRIQIPQKPGTTITMPGHGAALLLANADIGPLHLNYSTSQVLTQANTAQGPYLVLYGPAGATEKPTLPFPARPCPCSTMPMSMYPGRTANYG